VRLSEDLWAFDAVPQSVGAARAAIREVAAHHDAEEDLADAMVLCVSEAVSNVVVHAYRDHDVPGRVELQTTVVDDGLCVYVRDHGRGIAPRVDSPGLGLGLPLMANLSEHFEVRSRTGGGTEVVLHFPLG